MNYFNWLVVTMLTVFAGQMMAETPVQACTPKERQQFYEEILVAGQGTNADALKYLHGKLITDGYTGQVQVLNKECGDVQSKTDEIQFFELTYRLEKPSKVHPQLFAEIVILQLTGSYQVNDDGSYKYLRIRVLTSAESIGTPNGGTGSSSTAN